MATKQNIRTFEHHGTTHYAVSDVVGALSGNGVNGQEAWERIHSQLANDAMMRSVYGRPAQGILSSIATVRDSKNGLPVEAAPIATVVEIARRIQSQAAKKFVADYDAQAAGPRTTLQQMKKRPVKINKQ